MQINKKIYKESSGFSLIELLVVVAIFMFVTIPIMGVFSSSYESYIVQDDISDIQQNVRSAMTIIERDIRMAGAGLENLVFFDPDEEAFGLQLDNSFRANGSDKLIVSYVKFTESPCDDGGNAAGLVFCDELDILWNAEGMPVSSSESDIALETPLEDSGWDEGQCYCGEVYSTNPGIPAIITSPDGKNSQLFLVTQVQENATGGGKTGGHLQNHPVNNHPDFGKVDNKVVNAYPKNSTISFFLTDTYQQIEYFLGDDNGGNLDVLYRRIVPYSLMDDCADGSNTCPAPEPLAENVEDLQFALYGDYDEDGSIDMDTGCGSNDDCRNGEDLLYIRGDDANNAEIALTRVAKISILGRTNKEHRELAKEPKPAVEDNAAGAADFYRRRLLKSEVKSRNMDISAD